ncbi:MAG TPA: AsmA-like C-terminal region-containing protein [Bryobacteraceae bacterium]|nr:AsmA-like C-terminal region-containing protein [Bryobacteraceae bacterium]
MTARKKYWLAGIGALVGLAVAGAFLAASRMAKRFEPMIREQAISYLSERFHSQVEIASLRVNPPKMSIIQILLRHGRGAMVGVEGQGVSMRFEGMRDLPPLFQIKKLFFIVDLGVLTAPRKTVEFVSLDGVEINIPPKGYRPDLAVSNGWGKDASGKLNVLIKDAQFNNALLVIHPRDKSKQPLRFEIEHLRMRSVGVDSAMKYTAAMTIPKPPGTLHSEGSFGPWVALEPGDTPLVGNYIFDKVNLGVFNAIAGTLNSTGQFDGTLDTVRARGEANVPNFHLKAVGNSIPLSTRFEVLVDGTNGNTVLQPVRARLGKTNFTTTGTVIKHENQALRTISLKVLMPHGDMRDLLRLAVKGAPFMEGEINLRSRIDIPPLTGPVKEKLRLDGDFDISSAKFLRSTIQEQIDQLSRRGQGQPKNLEIDEVVSNMKGSFRLEDQLMTFRSMSFDVPGANVEMAGDYNLAKDIIDFHGALKLDAKVSQTMTGWKRWALRPADPFFSKHGAGTYLKIKVDGTSKQPKFGLDRKRGAGAGQDSKTAQNTKLDSK